MQVISIQFITLNQWAKIYITRLCVRHVVDDIDLVLIVSVEV